MRFFDPWPFGAFGLRPLLPYLGELQRQPGGGFHQRRALKELGAQDRVPFFDYPKVDLNPGWLISPKGKPLGLSRLWGSQKTEPWRRNFRVSGVSDAGVHPCLVLPRDFSSGPFYTLPSVQDLFGLKKPEALCH